MINVNGTLYGTTEGGGAYGVFRGWGRLQDHDKWLLTTLTQLWIRLRMESTLGQRFSTWGGTLYGTTAGGGTYGKGTIFSMSLSGNETVLHSFGYGSDGATPLAGLVDVKGKLKVRHLPAARMAMEPGLWLKP